MRSIEDQVEMIYLWKEKIALYRDLVNEAEAELAKQLEEIGERSAHAKLDTGETLVATVVRSETTEFDEVGLKNALGMHFFYVTDQRVNRAKLEEAMRSRLVDAETVAKYTLVRDKKPYVRVTKVREDSDE